MKRGVHLASKVLSLNTHFVKFTDGILFNKFATKRRKNASMNIKFAGRRSEKIAPGRTTLLS
jgi:hypothetical protein